MSSCAFPLRRASQRRPRLRARPSREPERPAHTSAVSPAPRRVSRATPGMPLCGAASHEGTLYISRREGAESPVPGGAAQARRGILKTAKLPHTVRAPGHWGQDRGSLLENLVSPVCLPAPPCTGDDTIIIISLTYRHLELGIDSLARPNLGTRQNHPFEQFCCLKCLRIPSS